MDEILAEGRYLRFLKRDGYEMIERIHCAGIVVVIPLTRAGEIVLVDQYRRPLQGRVIELPAGLVGDLHDAKDESFESAGKRELFEETGYEADQLEFLGEWPTSCGMTSETVRMYLAREARKVGVGGGDETEDIEVCVVPLTSVHTWLREQEATGKKIDPKVYAGLYWALSREAR